MSFTNEEMEQMIGKAVIEMLRKENLRIVWITE